jgi:hypothetical protein
MGKFLQVYTIEASNKFKHDDMLTFNIETNYIEEALNAKIKRNIPSCFGKIIVEVLPHDFLNAPFFEDNGDICKKSTPINMPEYLSADRDKKNEIVYRILTESFRHSSPKANLDLSLLQDALDEVRNNNFTFTKETKRRVTNRNKTIGARLVMEFDLVSMSVYAMTSGQKAKPEKKQLMYKFERDIDGLYIFRNKPYLEFIDNNSVGFFLRGEPCIPQFSINVVALD